MKHLFKHIYIIGVIFAIIATTAACSVKYAFNGASIDYTKTKTIELAEFLFAAPMSGDLWDRCSTIS